MKRLNLIIIFSVIHLIICFPANAQWTNQFSGTKVRLRGLSVVSDRVAWASGAGGTFVRTTDGGSTWQAKVVAGAEMLDFRDVHAVDASTAVLLSIGPGELSRILKTTDAGASCTTLYKNPDPRGFLDAISFRDAEHGIAMGDPVNGHFVILSTDDGGKTWSPIPSDQMPPALTSEGAFAASGTCLVADRHGHAWFGTGGAGVGRVFGSNDFGKTWDAKSTPIDADLPSSGIFSLAFSDAKNGVAVGGDYKNPARNCTRVVLTSDGGRTWRRPTGPPIAGFRSAVAFVPGTKHRILVAVGPTGSDVSDDGGESWRSFGTTGFHAVAFSETGNGWAVGEYGRIARFSPKPER